VLHYPIDQVVERYVEERHVPPELAAEHELELKRFLALNILNPSTRYGMRGPVDDLWHTFILFTREYATFCEEVAGGFIHHEPSTQQDPEAAPAGSEDPYLTMLRDYEELFGEAPPHVWPRGADLRIRIGRNERGGL
jgi:hypothetical protein